MANSQSEGISQPFVDVDVVQETPNMPGEGAEQQVDVVMPAEVAATNVNEVEVNGGGIIAGNRVRTVRGRNRERWAIERPEVVRFNSHGQAVAPSKTVARYARFLGQQAIDHGLFPIDMLDWRHFRGRVLDRAWGKIEVPSSKFAYGRRESLAHG